MLKSGDWVRVRPESKWPYPKFGYIIVAPLLMGKPSSVDSIITLVEFVDGYRKIYQVFDLIPVSEEEHALKVLGDSYFI